MHTSCTTGTCNIFSQDIHFLKTVLQDEVFLRKYNHEFRYFLGVAEFIYLRKVCCYVHKIIMIRQVA